jgi:hypothetical protein
MAQLPPEWARDDERIQQPLAHPLVHRHLNRDPSQRAIRIPTADAGAAAEAACNDADTDPMPRAGIERSSSRRFGRFILDIRFIRAQRPSACRKAASRSEN